MADNTFLGLQPYTEDDAYRFKGRTEESQELFRLIVRNDFTVCYAESGEGKTSLLNAGVFPLLRENMYFPIAITFTSDDYKVTPDSFDAIIDRCIRDSIAEYNDKNKGVNVDYKLCSTDFQGLDNQAELQRELSKYSWWKLRNYRPQAMGLTFTPVFVFDQFEEVFNLPGSIVWTKKFFDWLENVSSDSSSDDVVKKVRKIIGDKAAFPTIKEEKGFKAVFSLRKEFIGELDYWGMQTHFIPALKDNRYCLKPLTYEGAKKVMTQQERFDEGKVEQVLTHFVGQYSREPERTITENLPAIPALLLSVVCDSWEKDIAAFTKLNTDEIDQSLNKILEKFYDETMEAVIKDLINQNKDAVTPDFIRKDIDTALFDLVDVNGKRVRVKAVTTLGTMSMDSGRRFSETLPIIKYKEILNTHRIIKITKIDDEDYVEIVHDCLCPVILKKREQRRKLEEQTKAAIIQTKVAMERKRNIRYSNIIYIAVGFAALFLTIVTTWSSSTGIKGCLTSIYHDGIWTYDDLEKFKYLALTDSLIIDDKDMSGGMTLRNNLAIRRVKYNLDSIGLKVEKCENLREIILGDDVHRASIDIDVSCKSLTRIYIGKEVSQFSISIDAIDTDSLVIDVSPQNNNYKWDYCFAMEKGVEEKAGIGMLWDNRTGQIIYMPLREDYITPDRVQFPDDFIKINSGQQINYNTKKITNTLVDVSNTHAYSGSLIESYTLKDNEKTIGDGAFSDCKNLKTIYGFPEWINWFAFSGCEKLEEIQLDSVVAIDILAFSDCYSLRDVNLSCNYGTEKIDFVGLKAGSFKNCWNLRTVKFPKILLLSPLSHWLRTFDNCIQLEEIFLPDTVKVYDSEKDIWVEDNVDCVSTLFSNCPNISEVHISPRSLFRKDTLSGIIYYRDIPVIYNKVKNYEWVGNDSLFYFRDGFLYTTTDDHVAHIDMGRIEEYSNWHKYAGSDYYNSGDSLIYMFPDAKESVVYLPYVKNYHQCVGFSFPFSTSIRELHTPFVEPRMWSNGAKDPNVCKNWKDMVLYVPWGTKQIYEKDYRFREFKEIREDSIWWRMYMTIHYAFNKLLAKPWKFFIIVLMIILIFSSAKKRIAKEKEKYNYALEYKDALFSSFCILFSYFTIMLLISFYIDYHVLSLF